jgi:septal ring factor EnvC (AmiA/AmiB activator)
MEYL